MDKGEKGDVEQQKRDQVPNNYSSSGMSSDWRFCSTNIMSNPMVDLSSPPALWDQPTSAQNMGYSDISFHNNLTRLNPLGGPKFSLEPATFGGDVSWNPPVSVKKDGIFLPNAPGTLPESLTQLPADSGFIERAARFSCFSVCGFSDMANPFGIIEGAGTYPRGVVRIPAPVQGEIFPADSVKIIDTVEARNDAVLSSMPENCKVGQLKTGVGSESLVRSNEDQSKQVVRGSGNCSDEPRVSGGGDQDGKEEEGLESKKRKRNGLDAEFDAKGDGQPADGVKDINDPQKKEEQSPISASRKAAGKTNKHGSQAFEPPKEEYIHVRARRGQATNSHSLAERVRREKISERMKFLQDLVPGCSKVTGKAVMLDEIINYVQSLQRQVEFLSMKIAAVNPRLDFNIEGLLAKDILHSRAGPSSTLGFFPNMPMPIPPVHPLPEGLIQESISGTWSPNSLRRNLHNQNNHVAGGGSRESAQLPNVWEDELNNVVQMGFNGNTPVSSQDNTDGSIQADHGRAEL